MVSRSSKGSSSGVRLRAGDGSLEGADGIVGPKSGEIHGNVIDWIHEVMLENISKERIVRARFTGRWLVRIAVP